MAFVEIIKNKIVERAVEAVVTAFVVFIGWVAVQIAPLLLPLVDQAISKQVTVVLLIASIALNLLFGVIIWMIWSSNSRSFKLKYGIYWDKDKNPHCPNCKIPIGAYAHYQTSGWGYYCKPCGKVFKLTDPSGRDIKPEQVIAEL